MLTHRAGRRFEVLELRTNAFAFEHNQQLLTQIEKHGVLNSIHYR